MSILKIPKSKIFTIVCAQMLLCESKERILDGQQDIHKVFVDIQDLLREAGAPTTFLQT